MSTSEPNKTVTEYETVWYFADFWPGEYPPRFSVLKEDVVLMGRSAMRRTAPQNVRCPVQQFATFSPWNYQRNALDKLQYKTVAQVSTVVITEAVKVWGSDGSEGGVDLELQEGDVLELLIYQGEGFALYRYQGNDYSIDSAEFEGKAQFEESEREYDLWLNLPAENGERGWVLLSDAVATEGIVQSVGIDGFGEANDLPNPADLSLYGVGFASGSSALTLSSKWILNQLAHQMNQTLDVVFEVGGYADNVGSAESNQALSYARAAAVADYLGQQSIIGSERFRAKGYGDSEPVADNSTAEGREANRRVELKVLDS